MNKTIDQMGIDDVPIAVGGGDYAVVDAGTYPAVLKDIKPTMRKKFQSEEEELVFSFRYSILADGAEVFVYRDLRPGTGDRSNLTKDMNAICKDEYSKVRNSEDGVRALLKSIIGKTFLITVDLATSKKGRQYNKFLAVTGMPKGMQVADTPTDANGDLKF